MKCNREGVRCLADGFSQSDQVGEQDDSNGEKDFDITFSSARSR